MTAMVPVGEPPATTKFCSSSEVAAAAAVRQQQCNEASWGGSGVGEGLADHCDGAGWQAASNHKVLQKQKQQQQQQHCEGICGGVLVV
jgi:hypothetical protein